MKKYRISVVGCDDRTYITAELTEWQAETVQEIAEKITNESSYGCMPKMYIEEVKADE